MNSLSIFIRILSTGLAYLDPGSGSFILQILIATLLGAAFIVRAYWGKIVTLFRKTPPAAGEDEENKPE